jgi:hypothetical protein
MMTSMNNKNAIANTNNESEQNVTNKLRKESDEE